MHTDLVGFKHIDCNNHTKPYKKVLINTLKDILLSLKYSKTFIPYKVFIFRKTVSLHY